MLTAHCNVFFACFLLKMFAFFTRFYFFFIFKFISLVYTIYLNLLLIRLIFLMVFKHRWKIHIVKHCLQISLIAKNEQTLKIDYLIKFADAEINIEKVNSNLLYRQICQIIQRRHFSKLGYIDRNAS